MNREELTAALSAELKQIAPEISFDHVDLNMDLRDAFEIDSMDFQNLVAALHLRLNIPIPETDYDQLETINEALDYLMRQMKDKE
jgi:acyl carrier protein